MIVLRVKSSVDALVCFLQFSIDLKGVVRFHQWGGSPGMALIGFILTGNNKVQKKKHASFAPIEVLSFIPENRAKSISDMM
jgi:hypothetical protein